MARPAIIAGAIKESTPRLLAPCLIRRRRKGLTLACRRLGGAPSILRKSKSFFMRVLSTRCRRLSSSPWQDPMIAHWRVHMRLNSAHPLTGSRPSMWCKIGCGQQVDIQSAFPARKMTARSLATSRRRDFQSGRCSLGKPHHVKGSRGKMAPEEASSGSGCLRRRHSLTRQFAHLSAAVITHVRGRGDDPRPHLPSLHVDNLAAGRGNRLSRRRPFLINRYQS